MMKAAKKRPAKKKAAKKKFTFQEGFCIILFPLSLYGIWDTSLLIRQDSQRVGDNVAMGLNAAGQVTIGNQNIAIGPHALSGGGCVLKGNDNVAIGENTASVVSRFVEQVVTLPDEQIFEAMLWLMTRAKLVAEGAAASSVGAVLQGLIEAPPGTKVVCVLSGGNLDVEQLRGLSWN